MNLCDPHRNAPFPSTGERVVSRATFSDGKTIERRGDFTSPETGKIAPPGFQAVEIQHLPQKIDGVTSHLFIASLNGKVVGSVLALILHDKTCDVQSMFVTPANRGMGIGTRLIKAIETLARQEHATHLELSCNRGNVTARRFWIQQKFFDEPTKDAMPDPMRFICMVKPL